MGEITLKYEGARPETAGQLIVLVAREIGFSEHVPNVSDDNFEKIVSGAITYLGLMRDIVYKDLKPTKGGDTSV